jgi:hypothetical protein
MKDELPIVVAYGGGTNSVAMLCGFLDRNIKPELIIFSDTGGELPHTYNHIKMMSDKTMEWWGLPITIVAKTYKQEQTSLEADCLRNKTLPALAFGSKACSVKYKLEPKHKFVNKWMAERDYNNVISAVGYDAGEGHRSIGIKQNEVGRGRVETSWFPLIEWMWKRQDCIATIKRHGLPLPGKSSCFFCPSMKLSEIIRLRKDYPEYFDRAIHLEQNMNIKGRVEGLHFGVKWSDIVAADDEQMKMFEWLDENDAAKVPCGCYDG